MSKTRSRANALTITMVLALVIFAYVPAAMAQAGMDVTVCLTSSSGAAPDLDGGVVQYVDGGSWHSFGTTGANGTGCVTQNIPNTVTRFRMTYNFTTREQNHNLADSTLVDFQTVQAVAKLVDSDGMLLEGGVAQYVGNGAWHSMGTTNASGETSVEIFPVNTNFRMTYNFTTREQGQNLADNLVVVFQTVKAVARLVDSDGTLLEGGVAQYVGNGAWHSMGTTNASGETSVEIFPVNTNFRMTYNFTTREQNHNLADSTLVDFQTVKAVARLVDSDGTLLEGGVAQYVGNGAWHSMGTTNASGETSVEIFPVNTNFRMTYNFTTREQGQNLADNLVVVFQTVDSVIKLQTCAGEGLSGGVAQYVGNGAWRSMGTTDATGETHIEVFDVVTNFRMTYNFTTNEVSGQATSAAPTFTTTTVTMNSNLAIQYVGNGAWRTFTQPTMELLPGNYHFRVGDRDFYMDVSGCEVIGGGNLVFIKLFNGDVLLTDPYQLQCSGVGYLTSGLYFTNKSSWTCRARYNGIAGPWFTFNTLDSILDYEYATVAVTLYNDEDGAGIGENDLLYDDHTVQVSGVGYFTTGESFHVPADTNLSFRLRNGGIAGPWQHTSFAAGDVDWKLEFATVHVQLYNDEDGAGIGENDLLYDDHTVQVSGVGSYTTGETFHVPPDANLSFRLRNGGIAGPWQQVSFAAGDATWSLEFATVHVLLYNDEDGLGVGEDDLLTDPHKVQVSGVGSYTTGETFHVPPDANLSYRLRNGGIAGPWQQVSFVAGDATWSLEFATIHVLLYNGDDTLTDPHAVQVSGVGNYTTGETFHVPPGANLSFRLRNGGIAGPWQHITFEAGDVTWELEFATVEVEIDLPSDVASLMNVQVSGVGYFADQDVFHVPPDARLVFRLRNNGWASPWYSTDDTGAFQAGEGHLIWGLTPRYEVAP